jgi:hypothetical protein
MTGPTLESRYTEPNSGKLTRVPADYLVRPRSSHEPWDEAERPVGCPVNVVLTDAAGLAWRAWCVCFSATAMPKRKTG